MSEKKPTPRTVQPSGQVCPVCKQQTYSRGGIHPQCAVHQADAARSEKLKAARKVAVSENKQSTWTKKTCPKCGSELHVRRKACDCGHAFF